MSDDFLIPQYELAAMMSVDRSTITQWQRAGMPYHPESRGKANLYDWPVCFLWRNGRSFARHRNLPNLGGPVLVVLSFLRSLEDELLDYWQPKALDFARRAGAADDDEAQVVINRALSILGRPR